LACTRAHPRVTAAGHPHLAVVAADRRGPVRRPVDEQPVAEGHPAQAQLLVGGLRDIAHPPSIAGASSAKNRAAMPTSSIGTRSSGACSNGTASNRSNALAGMKPYATQSGNTVRNQRETVKPAIPDGAIAAPGSSR